MDLTVVEQHGRGVSQPWTLDRFGNRTPGAENDERCETIAQGLLRAGGVSRSPEVDDDTLDAVIAAVHNRDYLEFLDSWSTKLVGDELHVPHERAAPGVPQDTPLHAGLLGFAREGARVAVDAAQAVVAAEPLVYALCRPPGHHAGPGWPGGYCFLNNAALAVEVLVRAGMRPGVLDLDFHLGNGTAAILAGRTDARYASVHATTDEHYPWRNDLPGVTPELCLELAEPPSAAEYLDAVGTLTDRLISDGADTFVVSLGYDVVDGDPHGGWSLRSHDLAPVAALVAGRGLSVCVVQEGGYHLGSLEDCAAAFAGGLIEGKGEHHG